MGSAPGGQPLPKRCLPSANQAPPASPTPLRRDTPSHPAVAGRGCLGAEHHLEGEEQLGRGMWARQWVCRGSPTLKELCTSVSSRSMTTHSLLASCGLISGRRCLTAACSREGGTGKPRGGQRGGEGHPIPSCPPREAGSPLNLPVLAQGKHWGWAACLPPAQCQTGVWGIPGGLPWAVPRSPPPAAGRWWCQCRARPHRGTGSRRGTGGCCGSAVSWRGSGYLGRGRKGG